MPSRFVDSSQEAKDLTDRVIRECFPALENFGAVINVLFDTKKRTSGGKIVLGRIVKSDDLIRKLTEDIAEDGCDYIMFLDQVAFENINEADKIRLIRHELRHCHVAGTVEKPVFSIIPHDVEDFAIEIELNKDKIGWASEAAEMTDLIYAQIQEAQKEETKHTAGMTPAPPEGRRLVRRQTIQ